MTPFIAAIYKETFYQPMYGIVLETLQFSLIYQKCFDGTPIFIIVTNSDLK